MSDTLLRAIAHALAPFVLGGLSAGATVINFAVAVLPLVTLIALLVWAARSDRGRRLALGLMGLLLMLNGVGVALVVALQVVIWGGVGVAILHADRLAVSGVVALCLMALWAVSGWCLLVIALGIERLRLVRSSRYASAEMVLASMLCLDLLGAVFTVLCLRPPRPVLEPVPTPGEVGPGSQSFESAATVALRPLPTDRTVGVSLDELRASLG